MVSPRRAGIEDTMDDLTRFKQSQKDSWRYFAPMEALTTPCAARLVKFAGVAEGMRVLDVGCGTGVVAVTAALQSARVKAADLTPELLERARENSRLAEVDVEWVEADVEAMPFADEEFDIVLSQFAHMFAPRPEVAVSEMLRVLRPGGTIAFSTWPPELLAGRSMMIQARYSPPPTPGVAPPIQWGDPNVIRQRLGDAVDDIVFDRDYILIPALSPRHYREAREKASGTMIKVVENLAATDPARLQQFRQELDESAALYLRDNTVRQDYLLTRARKR